MEKKNIGGVRGVNTAASLPDFSLQVEAKSKWNSE